MPAETKMKELSVEALAEVTKASLWGDPAVSFTGVSINSRTIQPGECFFAIAGENFDGHDYLADAFAKGALCAVVGRDIPELKGPDRCIVRVDDTISALGDLARWYRREMKYKVVAITGSVGKTTVRHIIHHVLSRHFRVVQSPKSFNNNIGLPLTILAAEPQDEIIVVEIGSNRPGEIAHLTRIAQPDVAVVTNVHPAHLDGLGDLRAIAREKSSIAEGLPADGILIVNADSDLLLDACRATGAELLMFGNSDIAEIRIANITHTGCGSSFDIEGEQVYLPLPGPGNVENALAAWAVCSRLGLTIADFAGAAKTVTAVPMRAQLQEIGTLTVLNDCYNANPASMSNALEILADIGSAGSRRLVFICGHMAELGAESRRLHGELGRLVARSQVRLLVAVGELAQAVAEVAERDAGHDLQTVCFEDSASACNNLDRFVKDFDTILVKGSRTARLEVVVEKLRELYSGSSPGRVNCKARDNE